MNNTNLYTEQQIKDLLVSSCAIMYGHFILSSGLRSDTYVQCAKLFSDPKISKIICEALIKKISDDIKNEVDLVVSPALGGMLFGYEVARQLGVKNIFCERNSDGIFELRRGFAVPAGAKILIAEDVVTTGRSVFETINCIKGYDCKILAICSIINRSSADISFPCELFSLINLDVKAYHPDSLPEHLLKITPYKPGSRFKE